MGMNQHLIAKAKDGTEFPMKYWRKHHALNEAMSNITRAEQGNCLVDVQVTPLVIEAVRNELDFNGSNLNTINFLDYLLWHMEFYVGDYTYHYQADW